MREVHHHGIQGERSGCGQPRAQEATQVSKAIAAREGGTRAQEKRMDIQLKQAHSDAEGDAAVGKHCVPA